MTHRTKLKCIVNPILRFIQYNSDEPYVITSKFKDGVFLGYSFQRVKYR